jgi:hypothetical protein
MTPARYSALAPENLRGAGFAQGRVAGQKKSGIEPGGTTWRNSATAMRVSTAKATTGFMSESPFGSLRVFQR